MDLRALALALLTLATSAFAQTRALTLNATTYAPIWPSEANFKSGFNLEIGTDVQAYDADLAIIAANGAGTSLSLGNISLSTAALAATQGNDVNVLDISSSRNSAATAHVARVRTTQAGFTGTLFSAFNSSGQGLAVNHDGSVSIYGQVTTASSFSGSGANLNSLDASNLSTGTVANARLDADLQTFAGITPGTGVATALAVNVGTPGAPVLFNGAGGTPASITLTNATGLPLSGLVTVPKFSVHKNGTSQTIPSATWTKVTFSTEDFDDNGNFASDKWTPTIGTRARLSCVLRITLAAAATTVEVNLRKNGAYDATTRPMGIGGPNAGVTLNYGGSVNVTHNGSSDYFELFVYQNSGLDATIDGQAYATNFSGEVLP